MGATPWLLHKTLQMQPRTLQSMPRPLSWLDRLHPIAEIVASSSRSHYDRKDLQHLFEIQPRSAQNLMSAMPIVSVGSAHLVEREALIAFLTRLKQSDDPTGTFAFLRAQPAKPVRRRLRTLSLHDVSADLDSLPANLKLSPGQITVRFQSLDQLAETMLYLAALLQNHLDDFARRFEPPQQELDPYSPQDSQDQP